MMQQGEVTVFVSLMMAVLLFFLQVCLQSAKNAFWRSQTEEALELLELSLLSEYHWELLEYYDLFYLDLSYGSGSEDQSYLQQRGKELLDVNLPNGAAVGLEMSEFSRASDEQGLAFYEQAVSDAKQKSGAAILESFRDYAKLGELAEKREADYEEADRKETRNLEELKRRREEEEQETTRNPVSYTNKQKGSSVLQLALKDPGKLSGKAADLTSVPSVRRNLVGAGARGKHQPNLANDAFFHIYLKEHFTSAADFLVEEQIPGNWLDYQLEYLIAGKESDIDNLESICGRLLAMREGVNYAYLLTDAAKVAECEALALATVGATMIPGLVEAMKHVLLLAWAFGESVWDVRLLLEGKKVVFWKNSETWKLSLNGALKLAGAGEESVGEGDVGGMDYEEYLCVLLTMTGRERKMGRSLDVIEGVVRGTAGNHRFYIDQCVDRFRLRAVIDNGQEWSAERMFCYEW